MSTALYLLEDLRRAYKRLAELEDKVSTVDQIAELTHEEFQKHLLMIRFQRAIIAEVEQSADAFIKDMRE